MTISDRVFLLVNRQLGVIKSNTRFREDLGVDSLDSLDLLTEFEEEFDVKLPEDAADKFKTVGDLVVFLEQQPSLAE